MDESKVIILTGASRGLGAAVARWLGKAGAAVTLMARSEAPLEKVAQDVETLGGRAFAFRADVADPGDCGRAVEKTIERFGRIDALVNNAGILHPLATTANADPEAWRYNMAVNVMGPFHMARFAMDVLRRHRGRIVNVSSGAANTALGAAGAYCAAKAALTHFTRVLAVEEARVTSVSIRPGVVDTAMQDILRGEGSKVMPADQAAYYLDLKENGDLEPPEIPGRAIAWLALYAPSAWSGRFLNYDDPHIVTKAVKVFGDWA